jgi:hypothetical protein
MRSAPRLVDDSPEPAPRFEERPFDESEAGGELDGQPGELNRRDVPLPHSEDAEQAVLSAMLADPDAILRATEILDDTMFYLERHRPIFRAMVALSVRGNAVDPLTLSTELNGSLEASGGKDYIGWLVDAVPTAANIEYHAKIVREKALRRRMIASLEANARALRDGTAKPDDVATRLRPALETLVASERATPLLDDEEIMAVEAPPALVEGVLPGNSLVQLFGASGSYKSFVALDLACHIAAGLDWHGHPVRRGVVVYICVEGGFGMKYRVAAWKRHQNYRGKLGVYFFLSRVAITPKQTDVSALVSRIKAKLSEPEAASLALIIVDTKARNFDGNESAAEDESTFVAGCDLLIRAFGASVFVVHHTGWGEAERARGSSAAYAALDTEIQCSKDGTRVTLHCTKQKDSEDFQDLSFEAVAVHKSLVLKPMDQLGGKLDGRRLDCLRAVHRLGKPAAFSQWQKEAGLEKKKSSFDSARKWLIVQAYVKSDQSGAYLITDAGRLALGPLSIGGPSRSNGPAEDEVHRAGVSRDPAVDQSDEPELLGWDDEPPQSEVLP